jgi:hypothetical protein
MCCLSGLLVGLLLTFVHKLCCCLTLKARIYVILHDPWLRLSSGRDGLGEQGMVLMAFNHSSSTSLVQSIVPQVRLKWREEATRIPSFDHRSWVVGYTLPSRVEEGRGLRLDGTQLVVKGGCIFASIHETAMCQVVRNIRCARWPNQGRFCS